MLVVNNCPGPANLVRGETSFMQHYKTNDNMLCWSIGMHWTESVVSCTRPRPQFEYATILATKVVMAKWAGGRGFLGHDIYHFPTIILKCMQCLYRVPAWRCNMHQTHVCQKCHLQNHTIINPWTSKASRSVLPWDATEILSYVSW